MPFIRKVENDADWIIEKDLVEDFLIRLDSVIDKGEALGKDVRWVVDMKQLVLQKRRYSLKQDWALQKVEEYLDNQIDRDLPIWGDEADYYT